MALTRRQFLASSPVIASLRLPAFQPSTGARAFPTRFEELRRGVGLFVGAGGTAGYIVTGDGAAAIDSQYMNTAPQLVSRLLERAKRIPLLINSHHHVDHTGGNAAFRPVTERIVAHKNCARWHQEGRAAMEMNAPKFGFDYQTALPDVTFTESWTTQLGDETISLRHFGVGHTDGDSVIHFEQANVVHCGDLMFRRVHPRVDPAAGGSVVAWIQTISKILATFSSAETIFISGHAKDAQPRATRADVGFFREYLSAVVDHVGRALKAGTSKAELGKLTAINGFDDIGQVNERVTLGGLLEAIYDELSQ